ncbi:MAG TPA: class I SAM-dependent methyltransferase [Candidatus Acidoferrum sp.]|nr:class I SAM-dependent methyltransferase [Candidatus Acidoferrum sp.]
MFPPSFNAAQPEITDLIVEHDPATLERLAVDKKRVLDTFLAFRNREAMAAVRAIPDRGGFLDARAVDRVMLAVHWEMQRLAEEFFHGQRVYELLKVVLAAIAAMGIKHPLRVVDVGCGIGYAIRWLAARTPLASEGIELVGVDLNDTLIREAARLAAAENLPCRFVHGDAFSARHAGHVYLSTGFVHHFRASNEAGRSDSEALYRLFSRHDLPDTAAFLHYDFRPWALAPLGSWFFHILRMRTAIARHDGVLSTARAYSGAALTAASRSALPLFSSGIYGANIWGTPLPRVFHTLVGMRRNILPAFRAGLGVRAIRLGEMV